MCFESAILTVSAHSKIKQVVSSVAQQAFFKADLSGDGPCKGAVVSNFSIQKHLPHHGVHDGEVCRVRWFVLLFLIGKGEAVMMVVSFRHLLKSWP